MNSVGAEIDYLVLVGLRIPWEHGSELPLLPFSKLFIGQTWEFSVCDSVKPVRANPSGHVPMLGMYDEV